MGKWEIGEMGPTAKGEPSNLNFDVSQLKGVVIKGLLFAVGAVVLWNTVLPSPPTAKKAVVVQAKKEPERPMTAREQELFSNYQYCQVVEMAAGESPLLFWNSPCWKAYVRGR
jgi:hypothetical protein